MDDRQEPTLEKSAEQCVCGHRRGAHWRDSRFRCTVAYCGCTDFEPAPVPVYVTLPPRRCSGCLAEFEKDEQTIMTGHSALGYWKPTGEYHERCLPDTPSRAVPDEEPTLDAEASDLAEARATIRRLNRRCQSTERGLAEKLEDAKRSGGSLGRGLANSAAAFYRDQIEDVERILDAAEVPACSSLADRVNWLGDSLSVELSALRSESEAVKAERATAIEAMLKTLHESSSDYEAALESARSESEALRRERDELQAKADAYDRVNTPELYDFASAVHNEALHQRERWGIEDDGGKTDADWFWLIGYLGGKALHNPPKDDMSPIDAQLHRIITVGAAAANWHAATMGVYARMRPGIQEPRDAAA